RLQSLLGQDAGRVRFAMNAGMYDTARAPLGLYVQDAAVVRPLRTEAGSGNFYLKPNGVFSAGADGTLRIETTDAYAARGGRDRWATQSGPMLLVGGAVHPSFQPDGASRNIRNGVGVTGGSAAWFVISEDEVSFGKFARFFRDALDCRDALFLDGSVSSLWSPRQGRRDPRTDLGPMVVVLDKQ
ncbi:MAG TPA: phosphodiester glycosidase family protein, partial [Phenylobacterium sp.]